MADQAGRGVKNNHTPLNFRSELQMGANNSAAHPMSGVQPECVVRSKQFRPLPQNGPFFWRGGCRNIRTKLIISK